MAFFTFTKSFFSITLKDSSCVLFYRKLAANKKILDEKIEKFSYADESELKKVFNSFVALSDKNTITSALITDKNQAVILSDEYEKNDELIYQRVNKNFVVSYKKRDVSEIFELGFDYEITLYKALYYMYKNQNFEGTSMFILKFDDLALVIAGDKKGITFAKSHRLGGAMLGSLKLSSNDNEGVFIEAVRGLIDDYYSACESDFLENLYIYNDGSLSSGIGYVIFTKLLVKTELINVDLTDFINKISIKESR